MDVTGYQISRPKQNYSFKYKKSSEDMQFVSPFLCLLFAHVNLYCAQHNLPLQVTRVIDERIDGISISDTHEEGRAVDVSVRGWSDIEIDKFEKYFNKLYASSMGTAPAGKRPKFVVYHDGTAYHLHLQVRRDPTFDDLLEAVRKIPNNTQGGMLCQIPTPSD